MTPTAISLDNVSMKFILNHRRARSFQDAMVNLFRRPEGSTEEFWALRSVSFDVHHGETIGIIGQNGSGKSTVLKLVTRILDPTMGNIAVNGRVSALIELGAGFHPDLTGRENIYLNGSILGFSKAEMDRRFDPIVEFAELERFIDTPVKHYSSGMYMRLGFSVAISVDPDILIIDEVLAVGDEAFQRKCLDRIIDFRRQGKAIVFVSHSIEVVSQLCDRVVWLDHGAVQSVGRAAEVGRLYSAELVRREELKREQSKSRSESSGDSASLDRPVKALRGVELIDSEISDANRTPAASFKSGAALHYRVRGRFAADTSQAWIGFSVNRGDGLLVHQSAPRSISRPSVGTDEFELELEIASIALLPGSYVLVPYIASEDHQGAPLSATEFGGSFTIWNDTDDRGLVSLEYRWLEPGDVMVLASQAVLR